MTILQICIVHAKQSEITHTEMYLKQSYIPALVREVCMLTVTVEFDGNTSQ
jgi:hypothetical protein